MSYINIILILAYITFVCASGTDKQTDIAYPFTGCMWEGVGLINTVAERYQRCY